MSKVEETLAHQQREIQDLNDMVTRQWDEIDMLKQLVQRLTDKIEVLQNDARDGGDHIPAANQKPPHW